MIAAGLLGVENELPFEPAFDGNAYTAAADRVPTTLRDAAELWRNSAPRKAFGDEVIAHYANAARVEIAAFDSAVTDWEMARNFEPI
jgi:glutamine synthetase